jgi:hypothetical protein
MSTTSELVERLREGVPFEPRGTFSGKLMFEAAARLDELERENARLREALKPFAAEATAWDDAHQPPPESEPLMIGCRRHYSTDEAAFTLGDLRRARAALAGSGEK